MNSGTVNDTTESRIRIFKTNRYLREIYVMFENELLRCLAWKKLWVKSRESIPRHKIRFRIREMNSDPIPQHWSWLNIKGEALSWPVASPQHYPSFRKIPAQAIATCCKSLERWSTCGHPIPPSSLKTRPVTSISKLPLLHPKNTINVKMISQVA